MDYLNNHFLFIVGRGRSGTTLLTRILGVHEQVSIAPEGVFIRNLYQEYKGKTGLWTETQKQQFVTDIFTERRMSTWGIAPEKILDYLKSVPVRSFSEASRLLYAVFAVESGKTLDKVQWLGDKNPHYSLFVKELAALFPKAYFLFIQRDFRDNILSFQKVDFDIDDTAGLAYRWKHFNRKVLRDLASIPNPSYVLRYEDLVEAPEEEIQSICDFLDIEYQQYMLEFYNRPVNQQEANSWHQGLKSPINKNSKDRWKREMDPQKLKIAQSICEPFAQQLGYERSPVRQSLLLAGWHRLRGYLWGGLVTLAERYIYLIPLHTRMKIVNFYREKAGAK